MLQNWLHFYRRSTKYLLVCHGETVWKFLNSIIFNFPALTNCFSTLSDSWQLLIEMELFLLNKSEYHRLYNCSYDVNAIPLKERVHPFWGGVFLLTDIIFMVLYIPCVYAMCVSKLRNNSSYVLMIQLGVTQIIGLIFPGWFLGLQAILGVMFCSAPDFEYITGLLACNHWVIRY
jgi:hypothetical protein